MRTLAFVVVVLALFSCEKSETTFTSPSHVDSVSAVYFIKWNSPYASGTHLMAKSSFQYTGDKLIKRSGSYLPIFGGYSDVYTDQVYDLVTYPSQSKIVVEEKNMLSSSSQLLKWEIEIQNGQPVKRVSFVHYAGNYVPGDTALYYYDADSKIQRIEYNSTVQGISYQLVKTFYFDDSRNLSKVTGVYLRKPNTILYTAEEEFALYDDKANSLKELWPWDDLYYRSLSRNNFAKYAYKKFDAQNNLVESLMRTWTLRYDGSGNVIFK